MIPLAAAFQWNLPRLVLKGAGDGGEFSVEEGTDGLVADAVPLTPGAPLIVSKTHSTTQLTGLRFISQIIFDIKKINCCY